MTPHLGWRTALRLAWRDARASSAKFLFVVLAVAVGVGALVGVRSFSRAFRSVLLREARTLMAADLSVRVFALPTASQEQAIRELEARGVRHTQITETLTMAASAAVADPLLISVKAVDPALYPFYGTVKLDPPGPLARRLDDASAAVSEDLLMRLGVRVGGMLRLGGQDFRIAAVLASEPDRMTGSLNVGPRVMITRGGLDRTGLITLGSRASQRFLFRVPEGGPSIGEIRLLLKKTFPEATIADFRETHPIITRGLNRATTFLSLISLIALIVSSLGVATAMHAHLQQKMDSIAILKCLGANSGQVLRIYAAQTLMLGLAGGVLGIAVGSGVQHAFPLLIRRYFQIEPNLSLDLVPAAQGLAIGLLTTLLFTLPPLLGIREIRPAVIFRREMAENHARWRWRWRSARAALAAGGAILLGMGLVAASLAGSTPREAARTGAYFTGGLLVSLIVLSAIAGAMLGGVRIFLRGTRRNLPAVVRQGLANLHRPGNHAQSVLVALGVGVMFTLSVYLLQRSLLVQIMNSAPPGMPNVFLLDIPGPARQAVAELAKQQPGVESGPEVMASVAARLLSINGVPVEKLPLREWGRRFWRTRPVTWAGAMPPETEILAGAWWSPGERPVPAQVCATEDAARILSLKPGATLRWEIAGRTLESRLVCVARMESIHMAARFEFLFSPGSLEGFPAIYYGSLRVQPRRVPALQRTIYERYPTVTVVNVADVLEIVQQVVDQIALVVRFISLFAILAGAVILASSVAGTRFRRIREVVILKTLGATRRRVAGIFSVEFLVLGGVAGLMGSLLATAFSGLVLKKLLNVEFRFDPLPNALAVVCTALVANLAGWLASYRILGQKPLEVLREE
ncbi:MAG TPA: FtsX-like permease family protein [Bryobacteraceae bacterium]|nr:FtsX-like permease family protein [Bryobacteraceae bacterium]